MKQHTGIHFYISIRNYNDIIIAEEEQYGRVNHAIHALDTFFSSIEDFGKREFHDSFVIEKITGSRLHMYVIDEVLPAFNVAKTISVYAYELSKYINKGIPKYKLLKDFIIHVGVAYGRFYDYEFRSEGLEETTTIGYAANYAAKLQALTGNSQISIDDDIYIVLPAPEKNNYQKIVDGSVSKYKKDCYYTAYLKSLSSPIADIDAEMELVIKRVQDTNLSEIDYSPIRKKLVFANVSKTQCKKIEGIPVFADIRGFTTQFKEDGSNLEEMALKTQKILETMYRATISNEGVHVQFQGDRELALYHNIPATNKDGKVTESKECYKAAVLAAIHMIDNVKPYSVHIGVGEAFGTLFATKLGARGEKDNILLGMTVIEADRMEDKEAGKDQLAITKEVYEGLKRQEPLLADIFEKSGDCFVTTVGYCSFVQKITFDKQRHETQSNSYNKAWSDLL